MLGTWEGTRPTGRPRKRWEDGVGEDARDMGIRNWRRVAVDRVDWRRRLVEARARLGPVSYTHLDVYKRQVFRLFFIRVMVLNHVR